jgi:nucleotide-binding universal stress UspA family protein
MYKHILIPVDGSTISNKAAKAGIALAKSLGAKVTVYTALESMQPLYMEGFAFD